MHVDPPASRDLPLPESAPASLRAWRDAGDHFVHGGHRIFFRDEGAGEPLLLIHGFPTASWDWHAVWPELRERFRCIALDMLGFGLSDKPLHHRYSIFEQADLQEALLEKLGIGACHLLAHDYGDTVAQELLARAGAHRWRSVGLLNGGLFPEAHRALPAQRLLASPLGGLLARCLGRGALERSFRRIFGKGTQPSQEDLAGFWMLIERAQGRRVMPRLIGYMRERVRQRERWVGALASCKAPLCLIDGLADPVSGAHMLERFRELVPQGRTVGLPAIGHYPQLEAPRAVIEAVLGNIARAAAAAWQAVENQPARPVHGRTGRESITQVIDSSGARPDRCRTRDLENAQEARFPTTC